METSTHTKWMTMLIQWWVAYTTTTGQGRRHVWSFWFIKQGQIKLVGFSYSGIYIISLMHLGPDSKASKVSRKTPRSKISIGLAPLRVRWNMSWSLSHGRQLGWINFRSLAYLQRVWHKMLIYLAPKGWANWTMAYGPICGGAFNLYRKCI